MMDFGGAINAVKAGHKVRREAWDNPDKYICLGGVDSIKVTGGASPETFVAGPDDQLAEDWRFVNLPDTGDAVAGDPLAQRTYQGRDGPTIPAESIENDNVIFADTRQGGPVPIEEKRPVIDEATAEAEIETIRESKGYTGELQDEDYAATKSVDAVSKAIATDPRNNRRPGDAAD